MDGNLLMLSFLFGMVGMGFFAYGKKSGRFVAMGVGAGLMVIPYFVTNLLLMVIVCAALMAVPLVVKEA
ncbi:MAG TPA: hypothetical protein VFE58_17145 [Tepidisphaeraceae bacterium]|jgi:hypothetical protein|nr:hypothetical protein [Tepidisphaeraceae bacterium]